MLPLLQVHEVCLHFVRLYLRDSQPPGSGIGGLELVASSLRPVEHRRLPIGNLCYGLRRGRARHKCPPPDAGCILCPEMTFQCCRVPRRSNSAARHIRFGRDGSPLKSSVVADPFMTGR